MTTVADYPPRATTHKARRQSLLDAAKIRHQHPVWAVVIVALDARAIPAGERDAWLDGFGDVVDRWRLLLTVGSTDDARAVLEEMGEGPWTGDVLSEARTRRDELSAEIDDMVRKAQA